MEKTHKEIVAAVLTECKRLCPIGTKDAIVVNGITLEWIDYGDVMTGGLRLYGVADWMYIEEGMSEHVALHAYRLLGLEARDAESAANDLAKTQLGVLNAHIQELSRELQGERERSAKLLEEIDETNANYRHDVKSLNGKLTAAHASAEKLVEALEDIARKNSLGASPTNDYYKVKRAKNAIEAYKKGGVQG